MSRSILCVVTIAFVMAVQGCSPGEAGQEGDASPQGGQFPNVLVGDGTAKDASIPLTGVGAPDFVPLNWKLEAKSLGDLNGDRRSDIALVIKGGNPALIIQNDGPGAPEFDSNARILVVAFAQPDGTFRRVVQNNKLIPRWDDPVGEDPFNGIEIKRGTLQVALTEFRSAGSYSAGSQNFTFRWQDSDFLLIGYDVRSVHRASGETSEESYNFLTQRKLSKIGSVSSDQTQDHWDRLPSRDLISLQSFSDGRDFDPEAIY